MNLSEEIIPEGSRVFCKDSDGELLKFITNKAISFKDATWDVEDMLHKEAKTLESAILYVISGGKN